MLFVAAMLGHIYIGTIGMEGAFEAMGEGTVDSTGRKSTTACGSKMKWRRTQPTASPATVGRHICRIALSANSSC